MNKRSQPLIAILDTSEEKTQLLQGLMADEGYATVAAYVLEFKRGEHNSAAFFQEHRPQAVLYDIAIPYIENWMFFQEQILARDLLPASCFVVTTANRTALERLVGPTSAIEMIGLPFDLDAIVQAVHRVVNSGAG